MLFFDYQKGDNQMILKTSNILVILFSLFLTTKSLKEISRYDEVPGDNFPYIFMK